jgi:hypothetical protein
MPDELEMPIVQQMKNISLLAREIIIEANHRVALFKQPFTKMGAQESGPSGHQNPHSVKSMVRHHETFLPLPLPSIRRNDGILE